MGIPSYFSTIKKKYAKQANEWLTLTLPNNVSCKHLYVDLNGIVHTCAYRVVNQYEKHLIHTHRHIAFQTLQEMVSEQADDITHSILQQQIFDAVAVEIQALITMTQPTHLCYLALDGVAPRAKMEQQRQRRHRSVADKSLEQSVYNRHKQPYLRGVLWDSNCVTPGTLFMEALSDYLHSCLDTFECEGDVQLSDASECGEGEHKIMEHMRMSGDPNANSDSTMVHSYILHGQDADLIMLAFSYLASYGTHIPFYLLRDRTDVRQNQKQNKHTNETTEGGSNIITKTKTATTLETTLVLEKWLYSDGGANTPFLNVQYLNTNVLMKCVLRHMESYGDIYSEDEKPHIIRDYVALCFLLGNDFLPHSPTLSIQDKGIDTLFEAYVPLRKANGGFLTLSSLSPKKMEHNDEQSVSQTQWNMSLLFGILNKLAQQEDYLAGRLHSNTLQKRKWMLQQQRYPKEQQHQTVDLSSEPTSTQPHYKNHKYSLEHELRHLQTLQPSFWKTDDKVLAGTPGWKSRYYKEIERVRNMKDVHLMCKNYVAGLFWSLQYYIHGCWSTMWYYPHLSAPLFSNILFFLQQPRVNMNRLIPRHIHWNYSPVAQLLTVMPKPSLDKYVYNRFVNASTKKTHGQPDSGDNAPPFVHAMSYRLVPFSKRFRWECPVRLPFVDDSNVLRLQQKMMVQ